jgi:SAM-dependent methyltransferase
MGWHPHFSGGFWWANSNYVAGLSEEYLEHPNRYWREFWIGTGEPVVSNLWESHLNRTDKAMHYTQPYSKKLYSNRYLNEQVMKEQSKWQEPNFEIVKLLDNLNVNGFEVPGGTDKNTIHNYTGIYADLLNKYRKQKGTLLEIGVQHGGSSLLWHEYLPGFRLFLSDIQDIVPDVIWDQMDPDRYDFYQGDAYNGGSLKMFADECPEGFDIIIDDGPHTLQSQIFAVEHYYPMVKPGGVLIIEDIQDINHLDALTQAVPEDEQDGIKIFDNRPSRGRYDDVIWAIFASER